MNTGKIILVTFVIGVVLAISLPSIEADESADLHQKLEALLVKVKGDIDSGKDIKDIAKENMGSFKEIMGQLFKIDGDKAKEYIKGLKDKYPEIFEKFQAMKGGKGGKGKGKGKPAE